MAFLGWAEKVYHFLIGTTDSWREQIFAVFTRVIVLIAAPSLAITLYIAIITKNRWDTVFFILVPLLWLFLSFNRKLSFEVRVNIGLVLLFSIAVSSILTKGYFGSGRGYLIAFTVIAGLLLGVKQGLFALGMEVVFLMMTTVLAVNGGLPYSWVETFELRVWIMNAMVIVMISSALTLSISMLVKFLEQARQNAESLSGDLLLSNKNLKKEVQERIEAENQSVNSQQQLVSILNNFPEPLYVSDPYTYHIEFANQALKNLFKQNGEIYKFEGAICYEALQGLNQPCEFCTNSIILKNNEPYIWEHKNLITGRYYSITDQIIDWPENRKMRMEVAIDVTERKRAEAQLKHDALHDNLTGLANRTLFLQRLEHAIAYARRNPECKNAVLFFDLDNFKLVNDTYGHSYGDQLLIEIANRLSNIVREVDLVARLGGDEFVILLENFYPQGTLFMISDRILAELRKPFWIEGQEIVTSVSVGIVAEFFIGLNAEEIIRDADIAMYQAKKRGRNKYVVFTEDMRHAIYARSVLEQDLRRAIVLREFEVYYQPIINTQTLGIAGFEALIRWNHPTKGVLTPKDFWGAAEELNMTVEIGKQVIQNSIRQVKVWQEKFCSPNENYMLSINFSPKQLQDTQLIAFLENVLTVYGFNPFILNMEITEDLVMEHFSLISEGLKAFRSMGIHLHMDDFGKAYSSFGKLKTMAFDTIKIDRGFVGDLHSKETGQEIIQAIIKLARDLNMKTIAEGVENQNQLAVLVDLGCDFWQGYLFSKPMPAQDIEKIIIKSI